MRIKLLTLVIILYSLFIILPPMADAQFQNPNYLNTNPDVPQNFHTYTQSVFIEIASTLQCQIIGEDLLNPQGKCLGVDQETGKIGFVENGGGVIAVAGNLISMTFQIPISSTHYGKYLADNFGIAKKTQAQTVETTGVGSGGVTPGTGTGSGSEEISTSGTGFVRLSPVIELWKLFRNMVYLFFVFVFVIIGLGIMFRIKIDPRTVMTLQNQIPKIIIALVLVTFSYAIVGFLIDMMYVFLYLIYNTFFSYAQSQDINIDNFNPRKIQGANPLTAVGVSFGFDIVFNSAKGIGQIIASLFNGKIINDIMNLFKEMLGPAGFAVDAVSFLSNPFGVFGEGGIIGGVAGLLGGIIAFIVIAAAVLTALFRLWFALLRAYVMVLINTVLAPFWIAAGLIPGTTSVGFGPWFRDIAANLSAFPTTLLLFLLGKVFIERFGQGSSANFVPPFIGNPGNADHFAALIGLGIILLTPNVVTLVRQTIKAPETKLASGIGQSLGTGFGLPMGIGRTIGGISTSAKEIIVTKGGVGVPTEYGARGISKAIFGRLFGR